MLNYWRNPERKSKQRIPNSTPRWTQEKEKEKELHKPHTKDNYNKDKDTHTPRESRKVSNNKESPINTAHNNNHDRGSKGNDKHDKIKYKTYPFYLLTRLVFINFFVFDFNLDSGLLRALLAKSFQE